MSEIEYVKKELAALKQLQQAVDAFLTSYPSMKQLLEVKEREMAEAHLLNVQREIQVVDQKIAELNSEKERMVGYLNEGLQTLQADQTNEEVVEGAESEE